VSNDVPSQRYAKGEAKRRAILEAALTLVAERGYRNSTLQEIADAVDLSKAGVLHYFTSRENLIAEVIRERDAHDAATFGQDATDMLDLLRKTMQHNESVPGLVELYSRLVVEAESLEHPAHDYVRDRYATTSQAVVDAVRSRQAAGTLNPSLDPEVLARTMIALSDGLQLQWMYDRTIDMAESFDAVLALLQPTLPQSTPPQPPSAP
jgi:AcrR family transcriptional regulator